MRAHGKCSVRAPIAGAGVDHNQDAIVVQEHKNRGGITPAPFSLMRLREGVLFVPASMVIPHRDIHEDFSGGRIEVQYQRLDIFAAL